MEGPFGYYCAKQDYSRQNPAYDTIPDGYVPFTDVYVKYRTYSDSALLGVQLYNNVRTVMSHAACFPFATTKNVLRPSRKYDLGQ